MTEPWNIWRGGWQRESVRHSDDDLRRKLEPVASECDLYGHDYQVRDRVLTEYAVRDVSRPDRRPDEVFCPRCGKSWKVER